MSSNSIPHAARGNEIFDQACSLLTSIDHKSTACDHMALQLCHTVDDIAKINSMMPKMKSETKSPYIIGSPESTFLATPFDIVDIKIMNAKSKYKKLDNAFPGRRIKQSFRDGSQNMSL